MPEEIVVRVKGDDAASSEIKKVSDSVDELDKSTQKADKSTGGFGSTLGTIGKVAAGFVAANVIQKGFGAITEGIGDSIAAYKESIAVNAQLDAVLESTGGAANVSSKHIKDLASQWEKYSLFEDEAIISGQNMLLTFTNIKNSADGTSTVFDDATRIMLDMSQALGQDMKSSAIQLGKALNDPIKGVTALQRVGVSFTEQQKKQIETMVKAGDVIGAQNLILGELGTEFGGSAEAASKAAGASERYKDRMNDLKETIGEKLLPISEKFTEIKLKLVEVLATKLLPVLSNTIAFFLDLANSLPFDPVKEFSAAIDELSSGIQTAFTAINDYFNGTVKPVWIATFTDIKNAISPVVESVREFSQNLLNDLKPIIEDITSKLKAFFEPLTTNRDVIIAVSGAIAIVAGGLVALTAATIAATIATTAFGIAIAVATSPITLIVVAIAGLIFAGIQLVRHWDEIKAKASETWEDIKRTILDALDSLPGPIKTIFDVIGKIVDHTVSGVKTQFEGMFQAIKGIIDLVDDIIHGRWNQIFDDLKKIAGGAIDAFKGHLDMVFGGIAEALSGPVKAGVNAVVSSVETAINAIIDGYNKVADLPLNPLPHTGHITLPRAMAKGGIVKQPTLAWLGESGPEAVIPLRRANQISSGIPTINVQVYGSILSERDIERIIRDAILRGGFKDVIATV